MATTQHRTGDPTRIRTAHETRLDREVSATERAFNAIASGDYKGANARTLRGPVKTYRTTEMASDADPSMTPEAIRQRWAHEAIAPTALTIECEHAKAGLHCWPSVKGICGVRVREATTMKARAA